MRPYLSLISVVYLLHIALADDSQCKFKAGSHEFDLSELKGEKSVKREHEEPPSKFVDTLTFDVCDTLKKKDGVADADQCPDGTRVCLVETNGKGGDPDRITRVIPVATTSELKAEYKELTGSSYGINIVLHGPTYPPPPAPSEIQFPQIFSLSITCPPNDGDSKDPTFKSYANGKAEVEWQHKAVCKDHTVTPPPSDNSNSSSGLGYFFLLLFLSFIGYFALGAYYNYNKYGSSGWDLIPHRDFWREVPYMLTDVVRHLCGGVRSSSGSQSRGGYVQV